MLRVVEIAHRLERRNLEDGLLAHRARLAGGQRFLEFVSGVGAMERRQGVLRRHERGPRAYLALLALRESLPLVCGRALGSLQVLSCSLHARARLDEVAGNGLDLRLGRSKGLDCSGGCRLLLLRLLEPLSRLAQGRLALVQPLVEVALAFLERCDRRLDLAGVPEVVAVLVLALDKRRDARPRADSVLDGFAVPTRVALQGPRAGE